MVAIDLKIDDFQPMHRSFSISVAPRFGITEAKAKELADEIQMVWKL